MARTIIKVPASQRHAKHPQQVSKQGDPSGASPGDFDRLYTIRQAADLTGLHYWLLLRAVNSGDVPSYQFGNARRRVRLPDIEAVITVAGRGGRA